LGQIVPDLVDPESDHVQPQIKWALVTYLVSATQFAIPISVVPLAVDLDVQSSVACHESEVEHALLYLTLRNRAQAFGMRRSVEQPHRADVDDA
jgi:hypothetical protein